VTAQRGKEKGKRGKGEEGKKWAALTFSPLLLLSSTSRDESGNVPTFER
jgi:hypothetical protein